MTTTLTELIKKQVESCQDLYVKKFYLTTKECNIGNTTQLESQICIMCETLSSQLGYRFHVEALNDCCYVKAIKIPPKGCKIYQCFREKHNTERNINN